MYAIYDENEIGALDCDEIEGYVAPDSDLVLQCAAEFEKKQREDVSITQKYNEKYKCTKIFFVLIDGKYCRAYEGQNEDYRERILEFGR